MSVKLRRKKLSDGRQSLYLDVYRSGKRRYEFLQLYLGKDRTANKETMRLAESIRAKRELEISSQPHGFIPAYRQQADFVAYFERLTDSKKKSNTSWRNTLKHLKDFTGGSLRLSAVDEKWLEQFREYLLSKVSRGSARPYFGTIRAALNRAVREQLRTWAEEAKVKKHLTYHVSRHTFATLALSSDVDLYTVSKLLGHKNIQTTQVYAKIVDKKKEEAVNRLPEISVEL